MHSSNNLETLNLRRRNFRLPSWSVSKLFDCNDAEPLDSSGVASVLVAGVSEQLYVLVVSSTLQTRRKCLALVASLLA
jgi:hypothetical protein